MSQARIHIRMAPNTRANSARIITATVNWVGVRLRWINVIAAARKMPSTGTPDPSAHTSMVRPIRPSAKRRGGLPASSAWAATGRSANSVKR